MVVFLWWCGGGVFEVVFLRWWCCGGVFVVVLWLCFGGCVVVLLWWCSSSSHYGEIMQRALTTLV